MVITIDGSAGSGKSTVARKLAGRLEIAYLDTGAMYRAIALAARNAGADFSDEAAIEHIARTARLQVDCVPTHTRVRVNGHDVTEAIRSLEISGLTSKVARCPAVRQLLVDHQRRIAVELGSFVSEGRDQGSTVFPDADFRFVLEATSERRALRRYQEMTADGEDVELADVVANLRTRDSVDAKQWEPLLADPGVRVLNTTNLSIAQVIECLLKVIEKK